MFIANINELNRQAWLKKALSGFPADSHLLDAGASERKNRQHCGRLKYVSHDLCQCVGGAVCSGKKGVMK